VDIRDCVAHDCRQENRAKQDSAQNAKQADQDSHGFSHFRFLNALFSDRYLKDSSRPARPGATDLTNLL
jgi:hypothetical protein